MGTWEQEERNETRCSEARGLSLPPPTSHCPQQVRHLLSTWGRASQARLAWAMRPLHTGASSLHPSVLHQLSPSTQSRGGERGGRMGFPSFPPVSPTPPHNTPHSSPLPKRPHLTTGQPEATGDPGKCVFSQWLQGVPSILGQSKICFVHCVLGAWHAVDSLSMVFLDE